MEKVPVWSPKVLPVIICWYLGVSGPAAELYLTYCGKGGYCQGRMKKDQLSVSQRGLVSAFKPGATQAELREHLGELCQRHGCDPVEGMMMLDRMLMTGEGAPDWVSEVRADERLRTVAKLRTELVKYVYPMQRQVEVQGEVSGDITINVVKFSGDKILEGIELKPEPRVTKKISEVVHARKVKSDPRRKRGKLKKVSVKG